MKFMTPAQWYKHVLFWLKMFPWPTEDHHFYTGPAGEYPFDCATCGKTEEFDSDLAKAAEEELNEEWTGEDVLNNLGWKEKDESGD